MSFFTRKSGDSMTIIEPLFDVERSAKSGRNASIGAEDERLHHARDTTRKEDARSRGAPELDDRKMRALSKARDGKLELPAQAASSSASRASPHKRKSRPRLERRPLRRARITEGARRRHARARQPLLVAAARAPHQRGAHGNQACEAFHPDARQRDA